MEKENNTQYYSAILMCSSKKYKKDHKVKSTIVIDPDFEKKLDELMSCDHLTPDLDFA